MKSIARVILALMILSETANATCSQPVNYLLEGKPAACNGYLFTPEKELEVRTKVLDYDRMLKMTVAQDELIQVLDKRVALQTDINNNLRAQSQSNEATGFWAKAISFGIGFALASTIFYMSARK